MPAQLEQDVVTLTLGTSTVHIALKGATVFSYSYDGQERLFTSAKSNVHTSDPAAVRGGVPVCWPIFGPAPSDSPLFSKLKQHGFARTSVWEYVGAQDEGEGIKATFKLEPNEQIQALFTLPFVLTYTVHLLPYSLSLSLSVANPSSAIAPLPFQALLHSYFRLPDSVHPRDVLVTPLENLAFADKAGPKDGLTKEAERRKVVDVDGPGGEVDRVYFRAPDRLELATGAAGTVRVHKKGLPDVVLWNPGPEKGAKIGDMEDRGWERYVCLEPGLVEPFQFLDPGKSWEGGIEISFA
ncbi:glucose-6-phosphate 1-epimerase [Rhodotorula paludigena]|uniref:glucose-6-phosphate 1-epimerase n=1 Tax=Rhodotorula paludigena TaxID=86838 RepID=UPI00317D006B